MSVWLGGFFLLAAAAGFRAAMPAFKWSGGATLTGVLSQASAWQVLAICLFCLVTSAAGVALMRGNVWRYVLGFPAVFALAWLSQVAAGNSAASYWGLEYVIFALLFGLAISNGLGVPAWMREAVRTEYYIKTGLVIMGATILFSDIVAAGALGMLQACLVVVVVWYIGFMIAKRLRLDDEFSAILASAVAICGVSAAIAACGAIQGDRKKLSYIATLVLIVAIPMIVLQPWAIRAMGLTEPVGGAWLGGTLDTTGSVVAAGALVGDTAMKVGTIVKFSQNLLIGVAAFLLSLWWSLRSPGQNQERPTLAVIWHRFPKFVLGFVAASLVFSFFVDAATVTQSRGFISGIRTWWFALAFTSIGLETRFGELFRMEGGRPALAFVTAQAANVLWTLILAWLIFGGILFEAPAI
jgi:uncharacterized membrane protein YadS